MPELILIPCFISENGSNEDLPANNLGKIIPLKHFIVENVRSARRFLSKIGIKNIDTLQFYELNKKTGNVSANYFDEIGNISIGLLSEAGCPGIADPGAAAVQEAHKRNYKVVPLVGPSSIVLALMASGFSGQTFEFNGYLPIDKRVLTQTIKDLEHKSQKNNSTQIFIETPYRNNQLLTSILKHAKPTTSLCIASGIMTEEEFIHTNTIAKWGTITPLPDLHKKPTIFLLYNGNEQPL